MCAYTYRTALRGRIDWCRSGCSLSTVRASLLQSPLFRLAMKFAFDRCLAGTHRVCLKLACWTVRLSVSLLPLSARRSVRSVSKAPARTFAL